MAYCVSDNPKGYKAGAVMSYLLAQCPLCKAEWNYYDQKVNWESWEKQKTTAIDSQGMECPRCGCTVAIVPAWNKGCET